MKLSTWAKQKGISYRTAWRWFRAGKIEGAVQEMNGTIFVEEKMDVDIVEVLERIEERLEEIMKAVIDGNEKEGR